MNKAKSLITTVSLTLMIMTSAVVTQATTLRAFVSSTGNDANAATNCARQLPAGPSPQLTRRLRPVVN